MSVATSAPDFCPQCGEQLMPAMCKCRECGALLTREPGGPPQQHPARSTVPRPQSPSNLKSESTPQDGDRQQPVSTSAGPSRRLKKKPLPPCSSNPPQHRLDLASEIAAALKQKEPAGDVKSGIVLGNKKFDQLRLAVVDCDLADRDSIGECRHAIIKLAKSGDERAIKVIAVHARSPRKVLREAVAFGCGLIDQPQSVPVLIRLLGDSEPEVVTAAVKAFEKKSDKRAVRPLLALALHDSKRRGPAVECVIAMGADAVDPLHELLVDAPDDVCGMCAMALGRIGSPAAQAALIALLEHPVAATRAAAVEGLTRILKELDQTIDDDDERATRLRQKLIRSLIEAMSDKQPVVRAAAVRGIARFKDKRCAPRLIKLTFDPDTEVQRLAIEALANQSNPQAVARLLELLSAESPDLQSAAIKSLGRCGDSRAVPPLLDLLDREPSGQLEAILTSLARLHNDQSNPTLMALAICQDAKIRRQAVEALAHCPQESVQKLFRARLSGDADLEVRASAARALAREGNHSAISDLREAARYGASAVRVAAVKALGVIHHADCLRPLQEALDDPSAAVKYQASLALGKLGDPAAIPALRKLTDETDEMVRRGVETALAQLGESQRERRWLHWKSRLSRLGGYLIPTSALGMTAGSRTRWGLTAVVAAVAVGVGYYSWFGFGKSNINSEQVRGTVRSIAYSPSGRYLFTSRSFGAVEAWDLQTQQLALLKDAQATGNVIALPQPGQFAYARGADLCFTAVDRSAEQADEVLTGHSQRIEFVSVSPDRSHALTANRAGELARWDLHACELLNEIDCGYSISTAALGAGDQVVAVARPTRQLVILDAKSGAEIATYRSAHQLSRLAFHPTLPIVAGGDESGGLRLWNLKDGTATARWEAGIGVEVAIGELRYTPDGNSIISSNRSGIIQRWDPATGQSEVVTAIDTDQVEALSFSADGTRLAVGGLEDSAVWIIETAGYQLEKELDVDPVVP